MKRKDAEVVRRVRVAVDVLELRLNIEASIRAAIKEASGRGRDKGSK